MNNRLIHLLGLATCFQFCALSLSAQTPPPKVEFPAPSPAATVKQRVGLTDIEIIYSRPGMKGRKVFGGLVPYGEVWRTGANSATKFKISATLTLGGTQIPAGNYELFTIPGEKTWTLIIHKDSSQWGAYKYDPANDVARLSASVTSLSSPVESFTIEFNDLRDDAASLLIEWETTRVKVPVSVDVVTPLVPQIEALMASDAEKKPYVNAAMFYLDHKLDLTKAAAWMDAAIKAQPDAFHLVYRKARILAAAGDKAGALATAQASLAAAQKGTAPLNLEYAKLNQELIATLK